MHCKWMFVKQTFTLTHEKQHTIRATILISGGMIFFLCCLILYKFIKSEQQTQYYQQKNTQNYLLVTRKWFTNYLKNRIETRRKKTTEYFDSDEMIKTEWCIKFGQSIECLCYVINIKIRRNDYGNSVSCNFQLNDKHLECYIR